MKAATQTVQWPAEAIREQIATILPHFTVEVLPEIDSTNSELMRRAKAGLLQPTLLIAEKQTAGRGRLGRGWHDLSERTELLPGSMPALTFSLGLPLSPLDWSGLSLAAGVSVAQSLHPKIGLKWPNDLWLMDTKSERKLAGVLIETTTLNGQRYAVIGVGINICEPSNANATKKMTPANIALRTPPAWLQELLPDISAPEALQRIALPLVQTILAFADYGFEPFQARFNTLDVLRNRQVTALEGQVTNTVGTGCGVSETGALMLHNDNGMQFITSSEVSVRPI
jgi:BirA family transcriptional regulator, biotin operon repressor / biotin---[acetyl-CoA-carboxylase] ligase